jgi:branched-chain amino acid transport system permease protein
MSRILNSSFGSVLEAVRENETRARACGYDVRATKLLSFVLSSLVCGLAGGLLAIHLSVVPIDTLNYTTSGLVVMMTLLGGAGTFFGPFIGAGFFVVIEDVTTLYTEHWQLVVGAIFMMCVLFFPLGIWGSLIRWLR